VTLLESALKDENDFVRNQAIGGLNWLSYNEKLNATVAACVSHSLTPLIALFAKTTDISVLCDLEKLLPMAGTVCVSPLLSVLPTLTNKYQIEKATTILERFKASPTLLKPAILESLRSNDVVRRKKACYDSIDIADYEVVDALIEVLRDFPEPQYNSREDVFQSSRKAAAYALGKLAYPKSVTVLLGELKTDSYWEVTHSGQVIRRPDVLNRAELGMPAFGTRVKEGLIEAGTPFAKEIIQKAEESGAEGSSLKVQETKSKLVDNTDGTLTDHNTGLMWQAVDDGIERNQAEAFAYCMNLSLSGQTDWRLPTLEEFQGLSASAKSSGLTVNTVYNRSTNSDYWTSTQGPQHNVTFIADGTTMFKTNKYCTRAVRRNR